MKSKSFEFPRNSNETVQNKTYDFIKYYQPAAESNVKLTDKKTEDGVNNENTSNLKPHMSKRERSPNKKKKKLKEGSMNISKINNDLNLPQSSTSGSKVTSTPNIKRKKHINENVKSIMKNSSAIDNSLDISTVSVSKHKPKKRNKSVSFMLEDTEEVAIKRSKSELSVGDNKNLKKSHKNPKKKSQDGKENKAGESNFKVEMDSSESSSNDTVKQKTKSENVHISDSSDIPTTEALNKDKTEKKKNKRYRKPKQTTPLEIASQEADGEKKVEVNGKKPKKKKHPKQAQEQTDTEGEPVPKSSKKVIKPDVIMQHLENLSIGDNAHTLTNLLDEMTVVDKKKKKTKRKPKKNKQQANTSDNTSTDTSEVKNEEKEKVKWMKRKWNKDKKGGTNDDKLATLIIIENLPLKIMCSYKKILMELFEKFGTIKSVGVAEVYCIEQPEFFTTTINFETEDAANKALEEDNTQFEGTRIRIKRPLPPSQTTLVVRSYADLTELALSSVFTSAGRIRNVRRLVKGKKSMCTAFIEFDGPEAVERAIKMAEDVKIGGKKIFAAKFELRNTNKNKKLKTDKQAENDAGSDDSSD